MSDQSTANSSGRPEKGPLPEVSASVRLVTPTKNLVAFANISFGGHYAVNDIPVKIGKNGIYFDNPTKPNNRGGYDDTSLPTSKEMREAITTAITEAYGLKLEKHQAIGAAQRDAMDNKRSIKDQLQEGKAAAAAQAPAAKSAPQRNEAAL